MDFVDRETKSLSVLFQVNYKKGRKDFAPSPLLSCQTRLARSSTAGVGSVLLL